jgi:hypothetical protein
VLLESRADRKTASAETCNVIRGKELSKPFDPEIAN